VILRDKYGWPVERIKGRWFTNIIRLILHTSLWQTWRLRRGPAPIVPDAYSDAVLARHRQQHPEVFSILDSFKPKRREAGR